MSELPMPNDDFDGATVLASCWQVDDAPEPWFTLLLLNRDSSNGFYRVVDVDAATLRVTADRPFPNIIPAAACYSDSIGGY